MHELSIAMSMVEAWGENLRLVLTSVTEGEDKPQKYPTIFPSADVAVIRKDDHAAAGEFDGEAARPQDD